LLYSFSRTAIKKEPEMSMEPQTYVDLGTIPQLGEQVKTLPLTLLVDVKVERVFLINRRENVVGTVTGELPGHEGRAYFVEYPDGKIGLHSPNELTPHRPL
jgi:hypothetical protein